MSYARKVFDSGRTRGGSFFSPRNTWESVDAIMANPSHAARSLDGVRPAFPHLQPPSAALDHCGHQQLLLSWPFFSSISSRDGRLQREERRQRLHQIFQYILAIKLYTKSGYNRSYVNIDVSAVTFLIIIIYFVFSVTVRHECGMESEREQQS